MDTTNEFPNVKPWTNDDRLFKEFHGELFERKEERKERKKKTNKKKKKKTHTHTHTHTKQEKKILRIFVAP